MKQKASTFHGLSLLVVLAMLLAACASAGPAAPAASDGSGQQAVTGGDQQAAAPGAILTDKPADAGERPVQMAVYNSPADYETASGEKIGTVDTAFQWIGYPTGDPCSPPCNPGYLGADDYLLPIRGTLTRLTFTRCLLVTTAARLEPRGLTDQGEKRPEGGNTGQGLRLHATVVEQGVAVSNPIAQADTFAKPIGQLP